MEYREVLQWLVDHDHVCDKSAEVSWSEDSLYIHDEADNTMISIFNKADGELVCYVGCIKPRISVGGSTGFHVQSPWDIIDFLISNLEDMYDELMRKVVC